MYTVETNPMTTPRRRPVCPVQRALRAQMAAERREFAADDARVAALYAEGSLTRVPAAAPVLPEPARYTVTKLPSAVDTKRRAEKAAATRRARAAAKKAG